MVGQEWLLDRLLPGGPADLTHIAVGDGTAEPQDGDEALQHERARKALTSQARDGLTLLLEAFFDRAEANFTWREAGLFAGGTSDPDTGTLVARALVYEEKDNMKTATVTWEIEVVRT
jgi:hypothetical protein